MFGKPPPILSNLKYELFVAFDDVNKAVSLQAVVLVQKEEYVPV